MVETQIGTAVRLSPKAASITELAEQAAQVRHLRTAVRAEQERLVIPMAVRIPVKAAAVAAAEVPAVPTVLVSPAGMPSALQAREIVVSAVRVTMRRAVRAGPQAERTAEAIHNPAAVVPVPMARGCKLKST